MIVGPWNRNENEETESLVMGNGGSKYWNIWEGVLEDNGIDDKTVQ